MNTKALILVFVASLLLGCNGRDGGTSNNQSSDIEKISYEEHIVQNMKEDSIRRENEEQIELEILSLKEQGIFGRWECEFAGYESIISFRKKGDNYTSIIDFTKNNSKTKNEILQKKDEKYFVLNSQAKEYYIINSDRNLEMWDKDGLFTTARSLMPVMNTNPLPEFDINNVIGQNIFTVAGNYSKSAPETLDGTNNQHWIVYYEDLNLTFKVEKSIDRIQKAKEGKIPNLE